MLNGALIANGVLVPDLDTYSDTMKIWKCTGCVFKDFFVVGSKEDCLDVGQQTIATLFDRFRVSSRGRYVVTLKGGSHYNTFSDWAVERHGSVVDFEIGNWHSLNFSTSVGTSLVNLRAEDGKPVTYCYRWGCKPNIIGGHTKHLWWRSIGLTVYWWAKYVWHRVLNRPDKF
jgi:hypothetical protein